MVLPRAREGPLCSGVRSDDADGGGQRGREGLVQKQSPNNQTQSYCFCLQVQSLPKLKPAKLKYQKN